MEVGGYMKVSELVKLAKKYGCYVKRHGAEHDIWVNPKTGNTSRIPRHPSKEIPSGTANSIKKDLGLK